MTSVGIEKVYASPWWTVEEHAVVDGHGVRGMYNVLRCGDGVTVLAIGNNCLHVIEEFKYALGGFTLQLPSGGIDADESPLQAAKRELLEETGIEARCWRSEGIVHPYPTNVAAKVHLFVATELEVVRVPETDVQVHALSLADVSRLLTENRITHAASLACILLYLRRIAQP